MNVWNVEDHVKDTIWKRGIDYYESGAVVWIKEKSALTFQGFVQGRKHYTVLVMLDHEDRIVFSSCTCPYTSSSYCKHEAAVYLALQDRLRDKRTVSQDLAELLASQPKERLIQILTQIAEDHREMEMNMRGELASPGSREETAFIRQRIHWYIDQHLDDQGMIQESHIPQALEGARKGLHQGDQYLEQKSYTAAVSLYLLVIKELIPILEIVQDPEGHISSLLDYTCSQLLLLTSQTMEPQEEQTILTMLKDAVMKKTIQKWAHWLVSLLQACANLVSAEEWSSFNEYLVFLEKRDHSSWNDSYMAKQIALIRQTHGSP